MLIAFVRCGYGVITEEVPCLSELPISWRCHRALRNRSHGPLQSSSFSLWRNRIMVPFSPLPSACGGTLLMVPFSPLPSACGGTLLMSPPVLFLQLVEEPFSWSPSVLFLQLVEEPFSSSPSGSPPSQPSHSDSCPASALLSYQGRCVIM
ncbi:unnamed protein product [Arctogadus glacialis]